MVLFSRKCLALPHTLRQVVTKKVLSLSLEVVVLAFFSFSSYFLSFFMLGETFNNYELQHVLLFDPKDD